jgi:ethanolamine utilization cobalamin adenosyltransferase
MEEHTKPEHMTSLSGGRMVHKSHGRIAFRGALDSLQAEIIEAQVLACQLGETRCLEGLGEILFCLRELLAAEVQETPVPPPRLFGLDAEELRRQTHELPASFGMDHPLPDYTMGPLAARLNSLRAHIREAELCAVRAFASGEDERGDIILVMNRLSSALYWLFCRLLSARGRASPSIC